MSTLSVATISGANTIKSGTSATPPTIQDSGGTEVGTFCRAWVNFNGTGTVAIRASFNVTSITDNGVGDYTVNFTNAFSDSNYAAFANAGDIASFTTQRSAVELSVFTTSSARFKVDAAGYVDENGVTVSIFR